MRCQIHEIKHVEDAAFSEVMDIYQASFPLREQVRISWWLHFLRDKAQGKAENRHLIAAADQDMVVAMAYFEVVGDREPVGYLGYLATAGAFRGRGIGADLYQEIVARSFHAGCRAVIFEVELPEVAASISSQEEECARRRIGWYRRSGARMLSGIRYIQDVRWQPSMPMGIMVHAPEPLTADHAFALVQSVLSETTQTGALALE